MRREKLIIKRKKVKKKLAVLRNTNANAIVQDVKIGENFIFLLNHFSLQTCVNIYWEQKNLDKHTVIIYYYKSVSKR